MKQPFERAHRLGLNAVPVYYSGGERIATFRRLPEPAGSPEDWVASASALPAAILEAGADPMTGITRLDDGTRLRDVVGADPDGWLGGELAASLRDGEVGVLVKLLDAGERLPVHCHPNRAAARELFGSRFGKTEGWLVLSSAPDAVVWLGCDEEVGHGELLELIARQDIDAMLALLNRVDVRVGDVLYVPAGTPHAIGEGVFVAELQEPTSYSILAEYRSLGLDEEQATSGLGWERAIGCFDLRACDSDDLVHRPSLVDEAPGGRLERLFPDVADEYFRAFRLRVASEYTCTLVGYRVIVATGGSAVLDWASGAPSVTVREGETWLAPYALGALRATGSAELLLAMPPPLLSM
ncbi:MAG: class I mannose-6-phosphate isomerase [Actinomycetota bacterium]|nr:class I mannose-6-phosphate isomerase [Actinomycetota bacterium]